MRLINLTENVTLNLHQRYVLLQIQLADTPVLAFDQINRTESDVKAREMLQRMGYIRLSENEAVLTNAGEKAVVDYGLVDENGETTEAGEELLNSVSQQQ